jgi:hypothetical protein
MHLLSEKKPDLFVFRDILNPNPSLRVPLSWTNEPQRHRTLFLKTADFGTHKRGCAECAPFWMKNSSTGTPGKSITRAESHIFKGEKMGFLGPIRWAVTEFAAFWMKNKI